MSGSVFPSPDPRSHRPEPVFQLADITSEHELPSSEAQFTGHTVVDEHGSVIGRVSDVVYGGSTGQAPKWLVVDVGLLGVSHYAPAERATLSDTGQIVAMFDKRTVKTAPKAHRDHIVSRELEAQLAQHYELVS